MRKLSFFFSIISLVISVVIVSVFLIGKSKSAQDVFEKSLSSIVEVKASTGDIESFGTAVIASNYELVTNFHVISYTNQSTTYIHTTIEIRFSNSEKISSS